MVILLVESIYIRFTNPELTQMQFLIEYWELNVAIILLSIPVYFLTADISINYE